MLGKRLDLGTANFVPKKEAARTDGLAAQNEEPGTAIAVPHNKLKPRLKRRCPSASCPAGFSRGGQLTGEAKVSTLGPIRFADPFVFSVCSVCRSQT
jgi:hypothetical protein